MRNRRGVTSFLAAELDQIAGNPFRFLAIAQRGGKLRDAIREQGHAADFGNIPGAAMLERRRHPVGVIAALHRTLLMPAPEQPSPAAICPALRSRDPAPFAGAGLPPAQIGDIGIRMRKNLVDDELILGGAANGRQVAAPAAMRAASQVLLGAAIY